MRMVRILRFSGSNARLGFLSDRKSSGEDESFQDMLALMDQGNVKLSQEGGQAEERAQAG